MEAGKLRHKLRVQVATPARASDGGQTYTWATAVVRWAAIAPLTGRELQEAAATWERVSHKIKIRYYSGLTAAHRLVTVDGDGNPVRAWNIVAVLNKDEQNKTIDCICLEVKPD
ncbi:MAG: phage head closure protein [Bradyrhizobium sp.]|nr:phage head closure protein [Bradyrhizobium sp.]